MAAIERLPTGDIKRLSGRRGEYRLRVGGWRILFERDDEARLIRVIDVRPRGDAYKR
jgi:mRNA interferase RelE/StbE